jgi:hypothetical protein
MRYENDTLATGRASGAAARQERMKAPVFAMVVP